MIGLSGLFLVLDQVHQTLIPHPTDHYHTARCLQPLRHLIPTHWHLVHTPSIRDVRNLVDVRICKLFSQSDISNEQCEHDNCTEGQCKDSLLSYAASRQGASTGDSLHPADLRGLMSSNTTGTAQKKSITIEEVTYNAKMHTII